MRFRVASLEELTEQDWARWTRLATRAAEPNGWLDPVMVRPATAWHEMTKDLRVAFVEDDHDLRGVLAFTEMPQRRMPVTLATTEGRFMTWPADRHHPLVDQAVVDDALVALVRGLCARGPLHLVDVSLFPADGPLADALARAAATATLGVSSMGMVTSVHAPRPDVRDGSASFRAGENPPAGTLETMIRAAPSLKGDQRRKLWSKARAIGTAAGAPLELEDWSRRDDVASRFVTLQGAGWKGDAARGGAGFSTDAEYERWFRDVVSAAQARDGLVAVALTASDRLVALNLAIVSGSTCSGFVDCYDEQFRSHGPGSLARVATWRWALETRAVTDFDPALNDPRVENARLYPEVRLYHHVTMGAGSRTRVALGERWAAVTRLKRRLTGPGR